MPVQEQTNVVTMKGNPVTLMGQQVKVGQIAPECTLVANDLTEIKLSSFRGKKCILSVVPSLDTPVCDLQTKRFNQEAERLGKDFEILTISMDLPFAQKRWCGATSSTKIRTLSDYRYASFGESFGILIKGLRLLTRSLFLIDEKGKIQYKQIVSEITKEPDYNEALEAAKKI